MKTLFDHLQVRLHLTGLHGLARIIGRLGTTPVESPLVVMEADPGYCFTMVSVMTKDELN